MNPSNSIVPALPPHVAQPTCNTLRVIGHNVSLSYPIMVEAEDEDGNRHPMGLGQVLDRLDDFRETPCGYRQTEGDRLLACCFNAYEHGQMLPDERTTFESYVRSKIGALTSVEAARRIVLGGEA